MSKIARASDDTMTQRHRIGFLYRASDTIKLFDTIFDFKEQIL